MSSRHTPPWKQIPADILLGKRGLVKSNEIWLPLCLLMAEEPRPSVLTAFSIFLATAAWSLSCIWVNDLVDQGADRATGKNRWIQQLSPEAGTGILAALILGGACLITALSRSSTLIIYLAAVFLGFSYSLRPLRYKERGVWGPVVYSTSCLLGFVILPWAWLGADIYLLVLLAPAVFLDKWVQLHFHQVIDYQGDVRTRTQTLTVVMGLEKSRAILRIMSSLASLWLVSVLVFTIFETAEIPWLFALFFVLVGISLIIHSHRGKKNQASTRLQRELPVYYLALTFLVFRLGPILLLTQIAIAEYDMIPLALFATPLIFIESLHSAHYSYE